MLIGILVLSVYVPVTAPEGEMVPLIFETTDKQGLRNVIEAAGGIVTIEYTTVDMLAAEVPVTSVGSVLESSYMVEAWKDNLRYIPDPPEAEGESDVFEAEEVLDLSDYTIESVTVEDMEALPDNYYNFLITGAETVWEDTYYGDGTVVAVIDTGTYPWHPCFMWPDGTSSVIGGKSFAPGEDPDSWGDPDNHYHGTVCGGLIASHCGVYLPKSDPLAQSVMLYAPPESYEDLGDYIILWLFGMAPLSEIYAIKVFPKDGSGVPSSVVMQGIDHAICMRQLYEDTCGAQGVPIDVISMSLGGGTGYDGNDPEDLLVDSATKQGIVVVTAAGNSGPAFNTVETPGCANTSISVGAAADPVHTRVGWDFIYGLPGIGGYFYPYDEVQIIYFSSRGPTSDGRLAPDVVACGVYAMSLFPPDSIGIMSGTSASTPIVAGGAALLCSWQKYNPEALGPPGCSASQWPKQGPKPDCPECPDPPCPNLTFANPYQIRNALIEGALPLQIPYPEYAQGNGYLNVPASLDLLRNCIDDGLHLQSNHKYDVVDLKGGTQTWSTGTLGPGRTYDITIAVDEDTQQIDVYLNNVTIPGPPNPLMGDSIEFYIQSSVRTYEYAYIHSANITSASSFTITDPHPGNMRITVEGDWTNWGTVSCDVTVTETEGRSLCGLHAKDSLGNDEWHIHYVNVPSGTGCVVFKLWWKHDWSKWPTYDLDMYVIDPNGNVYVSGAQFWSPEKQTIVYPVPGTYTVLIYGYDIYHGRDSYWLRVCYIC